MTASLGTFLLSLKISLNFKLGNKPKFKSSIKTKDIVANNFLLVIVLFDQTETKSFFMFLSFSCFLHLRNVKQKRQQYGASKNGKQHLNAWSKNE